MEAVYLATEAGFEVALIDKDPAVPARELVEEFYHLDLLEGGESARTLLKEFDLVLPATENARTLEWLNVTAGRYKVPLAFDLPSYKITSSKIKSNRLFAEVGIAMPEPWPECGYPAIVKPSGLSGSAGVKKVSTEGQLKAALADMTGEAVIQKYLRGPSYSLEVIADRGICTGLQVTELNFDAAYDCKRVLAGPGTGREVEEKFYELGELISAALKLSGIMDIEVIDTGEQLKVLEIDARLPSQTPSAVYHSTGVNMVQLLADYWIDGRLPAYRRLGGKRRAVIYEHLKFSRGVLEVTGEHVLVGARGLRFYRDKFSTDVLISNFEQDPHDWVATAIFTGNNEEQAWEIRNRAIKIIQKAFKTDNYVDADPFTEEDGDFDQAIL